MKKLLVVALIAVGGYWLYTRYAGDALSGPTAAYKEFLEAVRSTRFSDAADMVHGEQGVEDLRAFRRRDADLNRKYGGLTIRRLLVHEIDLEVTGDTAYLTAEEEVRFDPPGVSSGYGSANAWLLHEVELVNVDGVWKVAAFSFRLDRAEGPDGIDADEASMWF